MIQLMRLKTERRRDLANLEAVKVKLSGEIELKTSEISDLQKNINLMEEDLRVLKDKLKKLEAQQPLIKKVEEFNALSHEMSQADRERSLKEQHLSTRYDQIAALSDLLKECKSNLQRTTESSKALEQEIQESIDRINVEGRELLARRAELVAHADQDVFKIYEKLLHSKKDRVIVPIENRCCSGCHISLTAQDENLVRKGERLVFCEHCSRIHYWPENEVIEDVAATTVKTRRRRATAKG